MRKLTILKRKIVRYFCTGICLSSVAFVFQACYGMPHGDPEDDICIRGKVFTRVDTADVPVQDIKVSAIGEWLVDTTGADGMFSIYVPVQDMYKLYFEGIEPDSLSRFFPKDTIIEKPRYGEVFLNIRLDAR